MTRMFTEGKPNSLFHIVHHNILLPEKKQPVQICCQKFIQQWKTYNTIKRTHNYKHLHIQNMSSKELSATMLVFLYKYKLARNLHRNHFQALCFVYLYMNTGLCMCWVCLCVAKLLLVFCTGD